MNMAFWVFGEYSRRLRAEIANRALHSPERVNPAGDDGARRAPLGKGVKVHCKSGNARLRSPRAYLRDTSRRS